MSKKEERRYKSICSPRASKDKRKGRACKPDRRCTVVARAPFFLSPLLLPSSKSYGGHETSWKYEGADGIVFNEVWPELHLPHSRHLGPTAVTSPRAAAEKLAGTAFPGVCETYPDSGYFEFPLFRFKPILKRCAARCNCTSRRGPSVVASATLTRQRRNSRARARSRLRMHIYTHNVSFFCSFPPFS